eukprot:5159106-Ditylum_brightwellii.AAC.1
MDVNQDKLGIISWRLWRKAVKIWVDEDTLCQPLGKWYKSGNDLNQTWPSYYDLTNDCLYWTHTDKIASVKVVTKDGTLTWQDTYCYEITGEIIHRQPATMEEYTAMLEKWEQEIINNVETLVSLNKLIVFMQQGQCYISNDGSANNNMMPFAWKVVDSRSIWHIVCIKLYALMDET